MTRKEFDDLTDLLPKSVSNMIWNNPFLMESFIANTPKKPSVWWIKEGHLPFDDIVDELETDDYEAIIEIANKITVN